MTFQGRSGVSTVTASPGRGGGLGSLGGQYAERGALKAQQLSQGVELAMPKALPPPLNQETFELRIWNRLLDSCSALRPRSGRL